MEANKGIPTATVSVPDPDGLILKLESLMRDGVQSRLLGVRVRQIPLASGGAAVVLRIPKSWNLPHRVITGNSNRFWVRNSAGVHEPSVEELRVLFNLASDIQERIKRFRNERIAHVTDGQGPVRLPAGSALFVHVVPISAFAPGAQIDVQHIYDIHAAFHPIGILSMTPKFNLDGVINVRGGEVCHGYTQVFRNGIIEATKADVTGERNGTRWLKTASVAQTIETIPYFFDGLKRLDVPPPIVVMVSYYGVGGTKLTLRGIDSDEIEPLPPASRLLLPEIIIDDYGPSQGYARAMRPIYDALWNAAGFAQCTFFDNEGYWNPPAD
jgi:hypothetical protein